MTDWYAEPASRRWTTEPPTDAAWGFHRTLPGYAATPLVDLPPLAQELGVGRVLLKDESSRLGLPAFKVLGASWACRQVLERDPGAHLVTATDGNHGHAVARTAARLGVAATVFVPGVTRPETVERIAGEGAEVVHVDADYDATVRRAAAYVAEGPGRALVQDTAWEGYTEVPGWIVEGYDTLLREVDDALAGSGAEPGLVAVPVGVGSLAEAVVRHYRSGAAARPSVLSVEPDSAACLLESLAAREPVSVATGDTPMAGLNCGTVSATAWPVLRDGCDAAVAVTDDAALAAVADLAALGVSSGACGAATLAGVRAALSEPVRRDALGVGPDSVVVLIGTEADHGRPG